LGCVFVGRWVELGRLLDPRERGGLVASTNQEDRFAPEQRRASLAFRKLGALAYCSRCLVPAFGCHEATLCSLPKLGVLLELCGLGEGLASTREIAELFAEIAEPFVEGRANRRVLDRGDIVADHQRGKIRALPLFEQLHGRRDRRIVT